MSVTFNQSAVGSPALDIILSRNSVAALGDPAPNDSELDLILGAAVRAPDHGRLRPWQFILIRGEARTRLGELFAAALKHRNPTATEAQIEKERSKPLRAPLLIAVAAKIQVNHKIPEVEQLLSAGAAATNMLNAIHALGYGGRWLTGDSCYDPHVRQALGLAESDRLAGFLYIGTPAENPPAPARPDPRQFVIEWCGPADWA